MSMINPLKRGRYHVWPLLLFLVLAGGALFVLWAYWPQILVQSTQWQRAINQELSGLLRQVAEDPSRAGWMK